jgi:hypothetical protein
MALATTNTLFPVYVYEAGMDLPKEGTYFVVAGNGLWMHKDTGIVRCFVQVENIGVLEDLKADAAVECSLPKIPARLVWRIKEFFRRVVEKHRAESEVTLFYSKEKGDYKLHIPQQRVSHGGVSYRREGLTHVPGMEDYLRVGTIHSHCDFGAFHSGTDIGDEEDFDGLHVTFGHNDRDDFTISATVVSNGHRAKIDPLAVLDGVEPVVVADGGRDSYYKFVPDYAGHDRAAHDWATGIDVWMGQVTGASLWGFNDAEPPMQVGEHVEWAGDCGQLREAMGDGPFEVVEVEDGKVVINTNTGLARLSDKLFKKVRVLA